MAVRFSRSSSSAYSSSFTNDRISHSMSMGVVIKAWFMYIIGEDMCGINGFIGRDEGRLSRMNGLLGHRGPDYAGSFSDGRLSMGHVLLSIRDAADVSRQPYRREGSPWTLGFNGQIYNTRA